MMSRLLSRGLVLALLVVGLCFAAQAQAAVHMADNFLIGPEPLVGEYSLGNLVGQEPMVSTFNSAWADGLYTITPGTFNVVGTGLAWPNLVNVDGGAVQFVNDAAMTTTQDAVRTFNNPNMVDDGDYWLACVMSFDANFVNSTNPTNSSAFTGIVNVEEGDTSVSWVTGVQWGFRGNDTGGVNAVVRMRSKSGSVQDYVMSTDVQPGTHLFVSHVDSDWVPSSSGDWNSIWFDPAVGSAAYSAGVPTWSGEAGNWLDPYGGNPYRPERVPDTVVFNTTDLGTNAVVTYDEVRFGDTWSEVVNANTTMETTGAKFAVVNPLNDYDHAGTYFRESSPATSYGSDDVFQVGSLTSETPGDSSERAVLSFSLDDVPEGTTVSSATLKLTVSRVVEDEGDVTQIDLYLADLPAEFDENTANWQRAALIEEIYDIPWGANGPGNPTSTLLSSIIDPTTETTEVTFASSAAFVAAVQAAINDNVPLDLVLLAPFEDSGLRQFIEFYSEDTLDVSLHPMLSLTFGGVIITIPGDTNGDNSVDEDDALVVANNWGSGSATGPTDGDFNADGHVNAADAAILAANWGTHSVLESSPVPEPSMMILGSVMLAMMVLRRRGG